MEALHCVICFEEFTLKERPPVVLPCGHTYVCIVCAQRLKKCMECREPLFWKPPASAAPAVVPLAPISHYHNNNNNNGIGTSRYNRYGTPAPQTPPHPAQQQQQSAAEQVPLPLPKNLVLLDVIEAAERKSRYTAEDENREDIEDEELSPSTIGLAGTYAVKDGRGLVVLPFDPNRSHHVDHHASIDSTETNTSMDSAAGIANGAADGSVIHEDEKKEDQFPREPFVVESGYTLQVVDATDEGVYKLARGQGFVVASSNQLVKVGGPLEKSCRLEGDLVTAKQKERDLRRQLKKALSLCQGLEQEIRQEQTRPECHKVICPPSISYTATSSPPDGRRTPTHPNTPMEQCTPERTPEGLQLSSSSYSTEVELGRVATRNHFLDSPAHSCPMPLQPISMQQPYLDGNRQPGLPAYRISSDEDLSGLTIGFGCGTTLFGERVLEAARPRRPQTSTENYMSLSFDDSSMIDDGSYQPRSVRTTTGGSVQSAYTTGATPIHVWGEDPSNNMAPNGPTLRTGSFDGAGVNFRTGMSGHRGLTQTRKTGSPSTRKNVRFMSAHRGIAAPPS